MHLKLISTAFVALSLGTASAHAQVQAKFVVDGLANCTRPYIRNYPIHIEGSGTLRPDRTADLAVTGNVENTNYAVKLGRRATEVEAGTASLRVAGRRSLRATREYPNNVMTLDLKVVGSACHIKVAHRLKPGKREYTFMTSFGLAYCDKPQITSATCSAR